MMTDTGPTVKGKRLDAETWEAFQERIKRPFTRKQLIESVGAMMSDTGQWKPHDIGQCIDMMVQDARRRLKIIYHAEQKIWTPIDKNPVMPLPGVIGSVMDVRAFSDPSNRRRDATHSLTVEFTRASDRDMWMRFFRDSQVCDMPATEEEIVVTPRVVETYRPRAAVTYTNQRGITLATRAR
jgi:hypothetical protein